MQIGVILPSERQKLILENMNAELARFRPDQRDHFDHLVRSWRVFAHYDGFDLLKKAVRRTLRDRP